MRSAGLVSWLVIALGGGYFVFQQSMSSGPGQGPPQQQIDVVAIRQRLLAVAQTERHEDLLRGSTADRGYTLSAVATGSERFTITATPTAGNKTGWPTLEISESMQVTQR